MSCRAAHAAVIVTLALPLPVSAFEPTPTPPGLTARAAAQSSLHRFLTEDYAAPLGLFEDLQLRPGESSRRRTGILTRDLRRLDLSGGYRFEDGRGLPALAWSMAGSVLAQRPASLGQHHFYCPTNGRGLEERGRLLDPLLSFMALVEGSDTVREFFTGTGFALSGQPAAVWINAEDNALSVSDFYESLARSVAEKTPDARRHHLALAMLALGGVLHVLQDMASPTHVRNDFRAGHLERLGSSSFNRGSAFERHVATRYGRLGIPRYRGPTITHPTIRHYFTNKSWTGLADITAVSHFSPGTLPPETLVLPETDARELGQRLSRRLPFEKPKLGPLDLKCARSLRRCHVTGPHGPLAAYRIDGQRRLRFFLDRESHAAAARHLLPLAVGYSAGLIDHLLRARVALERVGGGVVLKNLGAPIKKATAEVFVEDSQGRRSRLRALEIALPARAGARLATLPSAPRSDAVAMVVLVRGRGPEGDPLLATTRRPLADPPGARPD